MSKMTARISLASLSSLTFTLLLVLLGTWVEQTSAFSNQYTLQRVLLRTTPEEAYLRCLQGWREDNFNFRLLPDPIIRDRGDEETGVGFELIRIFPPGLREAITNHTVTENGDWSMTYTMLNPSILNYPVKEYVATISFLAGENQQGSQAATIVYEANYTPLPLLGPIANLLIRFVVGTITDYIAEVDQQRR